MVDTTNLRTAFSTTPTQGLEAVDVYKQEALAKASAAKDSATATTLITELYPDIKASEVTALLNDTATSNYLSENGLNLNTALAKCNNILSATGVSTNDLLGENVTLTDILKYGNQFKSGMSTAQWENLGLNGVSSLFSNRTLLENIGGTSVASAFTTSVWGSEASSITGVGRSILSQSISGAITMTSAEKLIASKVSTGVFSMIDSSSTIQDWAKSSIFNSLLLDAGQYCLTELISEIIDNNYGSKQNKKLTARYVLASYSIDSDKSQSDYADLATDLIEVLDKLDENWHTYDRNDQTLQSGHLIRYATDDALKVLAANSATKLVASIQYSIGFQSKPITYYTELLQDYDPTTA